MIKGCQKKIVFIKDTGSDYFEEAYFVMKSDTSLPYAKENDIVSEAVRIANGTSLQKNDKKNRFDFRFAFFLFGAVLGLAAGGIIFGLIF